MNQYRDRTNIKWKMAMMLPEHVEALKQFGEKQNNVEKPILVEQKLEELSRKISDAITENLEVEVTYWFDYRMRNANGYITKLDTLNKKLVLNEHVKIPFDLLVNITFKESLRLSD